MHLQFIIYLIYLHNIVLLSSLIKLNIALIALYMSIYIIKMLDIGTNIFKLF